jgi:CheY-like chemotaxis protein
MRLRAGNQCSILVVDDEPSILRMISRVLIETGCEVMTAGSAETALELVEASEPSVVIADIRLPGMSGVELTAEIKRDRPDVPVLLISAFQEPSAHDADGFIGKPFDNDELLDEVNRLMNTRAEARRTVAFGGDWPLDIRS